MEGVIAPALRATASGAFLGLGIGVDQAARDGCALPAEA